MPYVVRAFPVVCSAAGIDAFVGEVAGARKADLDRFYRRFGVTHESAHLQRMPNGELLLIVVTMIGDKHEAAQSYQNACEEFETWFKGQIQVLSGIDPNVQPLGPPTTEVFAWEAATGEVRSASAVIAA